MNDRLWKIERFVRGAWRDAVHEALPYTDRVEANRVPRPVREVAPRSSGRGGVVVSGDQLNLAHAEDRVAIRARLDALADGWEQASGLTSPLTNAAIKAASPAQRTLWEAASELREVLATWPSTEDEARAWRLRAWASSRGEVSR